MSLALFALGMLLSIGIEQLAIFLPTYFSETSVVVSQTNGTLPSFVSHCISVKVIIIEL